MANSSILEGKTNVNIKAGSGSVVTRGGNYILNVNTADIANYAREGADLVVEFSSGQRLVLRNFFLNGVGYNNLVLSDGSNAQIVDFSGALGGADGINDAAISYSSAAAGGSGSALLGILGGVAALGGLAAAAGGSSSGDSDNAGNSASTGNVGKPDAGTIANKAVEHLIEAINNVKDIKDIKDLDDTINMIRENIDLVKVKDDHKGLIEAIRNTSPDEVGNDKVKKIIEKIIEAKTNNGIDVEQAKDILIEKIEGVKDVRELDEDRDIDDLINTIRIKGADIKLENVDAKYKDLIELIKTAGDDEAGNTKIKAELVKLVEARLAVHDSIEDFSKEIEDIKTVGEIAGDKKFDDLINKIREKGDFIKLEDVDANHRGLIEAIRNTSPDKVGNDKVKEIIGKIIEAKTNNGIDVEQAQKILIEKIEHMKDVKELDEDRDIDDLVNTIRIKGADIKLEDVDAKYKDLIETIKTAGDDEAGNAKIKAELVKLVEANNVPDDTSESDNTDTQDSSVDLDGDDISNDSEEASGDEAISVEALFSDSGSMESFEVDLPIAPLSIEEDFAHAMMAASQIII